ncbi:hypothetical protein Abol_004_009 [Acetobacter orleanensis JCM 7639]|nr:hypothetical protein Abol_004_009 [Acetobacter orleanensis JCM 7639]
MLTGPSAVGKIQAVSTDAMEDHQEGVPTITFFMDGKGPTRSVTLTHSSGHVLLD